MTHHSYDRRSELLTELPDFWCMYSTSPPGYERTRALLRGSMEITRLENGGSLPPEPSTDSERAYASLCGDEYRKSFSLDPNFPLEDAPTVFLHNYCYPFGSGETSRSLHFLAESHSRDGDVWYTRSKYGVINYKHGPAVTHVRCEPHEIREHTMTPLLSLPAFSEDVARIDEYGALLGLNSGPPSYLFFRAMDAISSYLSPRKLEPCGIGQVAVERDDPRLTQLRVSTTGFGQFRVELAVCEETWQIMTHASRY